MTIPFLFHLNRIDTDTEQRETRSQRLVSTTIILLESVFNTTFTSGIFLSPHLCYILQIILVTWKALSTKRNEIIKRDYETKIVKIIWSLCSFLIFLLNLDFTWIFDRSISIEDRLVTCQTFSTLKIRDLKRKRWIFWRKNTLGWIKNVNKIQLFCPVAFGRK